MSVLEILEIDMLNIFVFDNFLHYIDFERLKLQLTNTTFNWNISEIVNDNYKELLCDPKYNFQFFHKFDLDKINEDKLLSKFLNSIAAEYFLRVKLNCNPCNENIFEHAMHVDFEHEQSNMWTAIYYLNTNDGYTRFENGPTIKSVENRLIVFPTNRKHTGSSCTNSKARYVLNLNFKKDNVKEWATNWEKSRAS